MHLSVSTDGKVMNWHLHRPDRFNALGPSLGQELLNALRALQGTLADWDRKDGSREPAIRSLVITATAVHIGRESPIWIAGGDLKELQSLVEPSEGRSYAWLLAELCSGLQDLPIPVIAAIDGLAIGGGAELAIAADLRLATQRSAFHFKQLEVGLATGYGSCQRLIALVGQARATDLLLRCRRLSATEALPLGLVNELVEKPDDLAQSIKELTHDFSQISAQALRSQKFMLQQPSHDRRGHLIQGELDAFEDLWMQPAHKKFLSGFSERAASAEN